MKKNKSMKTISGYDDVLIAGAGFSSFFLNFDIINVLVLPQLILEETKFQLTPCAFSLYVLQEYSRSSFVDRSCSLRYTSYQTIPLLPYLSFQLPLFQPLTVQLRMQSNQCPETIPNGYALQSQFLAFLFSR